jgi:hypothetical protein
LADFLAEACAHFLQLFSELYGGHALQGNMLVTATICRDAAKSLQNVFPMRGNFTAYLPR